MEDEEPTRLRVEQPHIPPPEPAHWLPGPPWAWVGGAIIVFLVAIVLAFSANGGGDDDANGLFRKGVQRCDGKRKRASD